MIFIVALPPIQRLEPESNNAGTDSKASLDHKITGQSRNAIFLQYA